MKRIFADLHLLPDLRDFAHVSEMIGKAGRFGYRVVGVTFPPNADEEEVKRIRKIGEKFDVDVVSRVDLKPMTANDLLNSLRKFRRLFEVVGVVCGSKSVARQAAKDRRVDFLSFVGVDFRGRFFDWAEAELTAGSLACLEVDVKSLLVLEGVARIRLLSCLRREVAIARDFGVSVVISSGVSDMMLMRMPKEMAALAMLFDLNATCAIKAISDNPLTIVKRNRAKLKPGFVAPGIRIIKKGQDCEDC